MDVRRHDDRERVCLDDECEWCVNTGQVIGYCNDSIISTQVTRSCLPWRENAMIGYDRKEADDCDITLSTRKSSKGTWQGSVE